VSATDLGLERGFVDEPSLVKAVGGLPGEGLSRPPAVPVLVRVEVHQREHRVLDPTLVVHGALDGSELLD
jgi:hypothetical protein